MVSLAICCSFDTSEQNGGSLDTHAFAVLFSFPSDYMVLDSVHHFVHIRAAFTIPADSQYSILHKSPIYDYIKHNYHIPVLGNF